jgi:hypothetical protein
MGNKQTLKALEELVKTEHMAVAALDAAYEEADDNKLRKNYRKWRDAHVKQANALNDRIEDLGGDPILYEEGSGKGQGGLWGKLTGMRDETSVVGMKIGAERGLKRYMDHIDDIDDPKALSIIRKNLEAKQDEMAWYDDQVSRERSDVLDTKLQTSREKIRDIELIDGKKKGGGIPFPLILLAGAAGAAAFFLLRREEGDEFEDYGEDAFRYEGDETGTDAGYTSTGSYSSVGSNEGESGYSASTSHGSNSGDQTTTPS